MAEGWKIVDPLTSKRVGIAHFLTRERAEAQIASWQDRHDRGGRPDISRELLLRMQPAPERTGI